MKQKNTNTVCGHIDRRHYAKGMCQKCYIVERQKKTLANNDKEQNKDGSATDIS